MNIEQKVAKRYFEAKDLSAYLEGYLEHLTRQLQVILPRTLERDIRVTIVRNMILIVAEDIGLQMALVKMTGAGLVLMRGERPARVFSFKELMETDAIYIAKQIGHVLVSK